MVLEEWGCQPAPEAPSCTGPSGPWVVLSAAKTFLFHINFIFWFSVDMKLQTLCSGRGSAMAGELGLRGNRNLINCEPLGKTKLFLLPSTALWPPGREPRQPWSKPRAGRGCWGQRAGLGLPGDPPLLPCPLLPFWGLSTPGVLGTPGGLQGPSWTLGLGLPPPAPSNPAQTPKLCSAPNLGLIARATRRGGSAAAKQ